MLDLSYVRNNLDAVAARLSTRGASAGLEQFRELDRKRRAAITESEQVKAQIKAQSEKFRQTIMEAASKVASDVSGVQAHIEEQNERFRETAREAARKVAQELKARLAALEAEQKAFEDFLNVERGIARLERAQGDVFEVEKYRHDGVGIVRFHWVIRESVRRTGPGCTC